MLELGIFIILAKQKLLYLPNNALKFFKTPYGSMPPISQTRVVLALYQCQIMEVRNLREVIKQRGSLCMISIQCSKGVP